MPRRVDPGTIGVGAGLAPEGTVEDNSLRYPERDVDPLRVHVVDPSRAHMAVTIGIDDAGHCYTSDEVEGALQEICAGAGAGRMNGMVAGGFFQELALAGGTPYNPTLPSASLTLTLVDPTTVLINAHVIELGGATVTLPDNATNYIYVDCDSSSGTYEQVVSKLTPPPPIDVGGVEHVMLAKVSTGGGQVLSYQDARFFVADLDRKLAYSSREGENVQSWSEACFVTLDAALFWMEYYHNNALSDQETKTRILVRGVHEIYNTLTIPRNNVVFEGDGEAVIRHSTNSSSLMLFNITDQANVEFKDLEIESLNASNNSAIYSNATVDQENIKISRVRFTGNWGAPLNLNASGGRYVNLLVEDCTLIDFGNTGINVQDLRTGRIRGCTIKATDTGGSVGIIIAGQSGVCQDIWIENNKVLAKRGMDLGSCEEVWVQDNHIDLIQGGDYGLRFWNAAGSSATTDIHINENKIVGADSTLTGIIFDTSANDGVLRNHFISNNAIVRIGAEQSSGSPADGWAISYVNFPGTDAAELVKITDNHFNGWSNLTTHAPLTAAAGGGIYFQAASTYTHVSGNTIDNCPTFLFMNGGSSDCRELSITDNSGDLQCGVLAMGGVILYGEYSRLQVSRNSFHMGGAVALAGDTGGQFGVLVETSGDDRSGVFDINENQLQGMLVAGIRVGGYYLQVGIHDNNINGYLASAQGEAPAIGIFCGKSIAGSLVVHQANINGNNISSCAHGIIVEGSGPFSTNGSAEGYTISGNTIEACGGNLHNPVSAIFTERWSMGIGVLNAKQIVVSDNSIREMGIQRSLDGSPTITSGDESTVGVNVRNSQQVTITGNQINKMYSKAAGLSLAIWMEIQDAGAGAIPATPAYEWRGYNISDNIIDNEPSAIAVPGDVNRQMGIGFLVQNDVDTYNYSLEEVRVVGNTISHLASYAHSGVMSVGIQFMLRCVGGTNSAMLRDAVVAGNQIRMVEGFGVFVDGRGGDGAAPVVMVDVDITDNVVFGMPETGGVADTAGICLSLEDQGSAESIKINGNHLDKVYNHGIWLRPNGDTAIRQVAIDNNIIPQVTGSLANTGGIGIHLLAAASGTGEPTLDSVQMRGNRIGGDNGDNTQPLWLSEGIRLQYPESRFKQITIDSNYIETNNYGIRWTQQTAGTPATWLDLDALDVSITRNYINMFRGGALPYFPQGFWPIHVVTGGVAIDRLRIEENDVAGGRSFVGGGSSEGTIFLDHTTHTNPMSNWSICRNRIISYSEVGVNTHRGPAIDLTITHDNSTGGGGIEVEDIVIDGNDCQNGEIKTLVLYNQVDGTVDGWSVSNNTIRPINDVHGIYSHFADGPTGVLTVVKNVKMEGNIISNVGDDNSFPGAFVINPCLGITVMGDSFSGQNLVTLQGSSFSNNTIRGNELVRGCHGLYFDIGGNGVTVADNTLSELGAGDAAGNTFPVGIYIKHNLGMSWKNLNITGNTVGGAGQAGIEMVLGSEGGTAGKDQGWNISDNTLIRVGTRGSTAQCSGIKIQGSPATSELLKNVRVANNLIQVGGGDSDPPGIELDLDSWSQISQISVVGNQINVVEGQSLGYGIRLFTPDTSTMVNIDSNDVKNPVYPGIQVDATGSMYSTSMCDNNIHTNASVKVDSSLNGYINFKADAMSAVEGLKVDGNLIQGNTVDNLGGVVVLHDNSADGTYFANVSVCTNSIIDTQRGIRLGNRGFAQDMFVDWVGMKVDGNAIHNKQFQGSDGIFWEAGNQIFKNMSICDNIITHEPQNEFTGIQIATGGTTSFVCNFWDVSRNQILFLNPKSDGAQNTAGIYVVCLASTSQWSFNHNRVRGHGRWGIATGWGNATAYIRQIQYVGNTIESTVGNTATTGGGITAVGDLVIEGEFGPEAMNVFTVANNSLRNQNKDTNRSGLVINSTASMDGKQLLYWSITGNSCVNYDTSESVVTDMSGGNFEKSVINSNICYDMGADADNFVGGATWNDPSNQNIGNVDG